MMVENMFFDFGSIFIAIIFIIVIGVVIYNIVKGVSTWTKNNNSPILEVQSKVVTKRTKVSGGAGESSSHTSYYVTFEVASGNRMELMVNGKQFGQLVEGDNGILKFQGTRYLGFSRSVV